MSETEPNNPKQPSIMVLPRDVIVHIFSYLDAPELCLLAGVSKEICDISEDNALWKPLVEREWGVHTREQELELIKEQEEWERKVAERKAAQRGT